MTHTHRRRGNYRPAPGQAEPFYFDSGNHKLFGWLHHPYGDKRSNIGLVICKPFGYEAMCSHRSVRVLADAAAAIGVPSLRFDYLGTGDSANIAPDADQLEVWSKDVAAAAYELRRRTGVAHVCLLGIRLGALLAMIAARQCEILAALILVAPVISGRRYLRELRTLRLAASLGANAREPPSVADWIAASAGSLRIRGFALSAATVAALRHADLSTPTVPPVREMLIIDRSGLPVARGLYDELRALDVRTEYLSLPGMVEMLMTAPHFAVVPKAMLEAVCSWLPRLQTYTSVQIEGNMRPVNRPSVPSATSLALPGGSCTANSLLTERPVFLSSDALLFGIVTEPHLGEVRRRAVILLNVGAENHIGANRMYVSLARDWAGRGYTVLRLDLRGLGDSDTIPGRPDDEVFPAAALDDIRVAIEFMRARYGASDITLGGICSGAYHSLRQPLRSCR